MVELVPDDIIKGPRIAADFEAEETYGFVVDGRDEYIEKMKAAGYTELPEFENLQSDNAGYWCASCEYFKPRTDSPTGYWCNKFGFPDKPWGCSGGWEPKPELKTALRGEKQPPSANEYPQGPVSGGGR